MMKMLFGSLWNNLSIETATNRGKLLYKGCENNVVPFDASAHTKSVFENAIPHTIHWLVFGTFDTATEALEYHELLEVWYKSWSESETKCNAVRRLLATKKISG